MRIKTREMNAVLRVLATMLVLACGVTARAHEIPSDAVVRAYLHAGDDELTLLVRVPLESMRDVTFPLRGPGFLDLPSADKALRDAAIIWIANQVELYEDGRHLEQYELEAVRIALPSDRSFSSYASALTSITGPGLPQDTELMWNQALLDVMLVYPITSPDADFSVRPRFERLGIRTTTVLRFVTHAGVVRPYEFIGDPGLLRLDPRWHHAFFRFIVLGFEHILDGVDHLLFILCLIVPLRRIRPLVVIVTSFTVAHSITLLSSAFGFVPSVSWFPPLIETLIAA
ncbi:MAG TPA: HupE/UreJ family protein, partial [Woeseiaceae bacterium]|nr:HupE/UreJ family protein [Woeseiaceae bacterium]